LSDTKRTYIQSQSHPPSTCQRDLHPDKSWTSPSQEPVRLLATIYTTKARQQRRRNPVIQAVSHAKAHKWYPAFPWHPQATSSGITKRLADILYTSALTESLLFQLHPATNFKQATSHRHTPRRYYNLAIYHLLHHLLYTHQSQCSPASTTSVAAEADAMPNLAAAITASCSTFNQHAQLAHHQ
jgi:hypothetical protein